jgi:pectate lyase
LSFAANLNHTAQTSGEMLASLATAMGGCGTGNPIDDCWRCDPNWRSHRQALANCAIGFGRNAIGGKNGKIYVVTSNGDNAQNPPFGTLRYGVTRTEPLWIIFAQSMTIQLDAELVMTSFKTIDGRGATVHIVGGSQITVKQISHVIIFGIHIHDIRPSGPSTILVAPSQLANHGTSDGDAIHIWGSTNVWVDHCYLANAFDGLIDCTRGSSLITISNNYFTNHNKVPIYLHLYIHTYSYICLVRDTLVQFCVCVPYEQRGSSFMLAPFKVGITIFVNFRLSLVSN